MFFVFDVETIPDFEFVRQVIENPETDEDELLIQASEDLARNSSGFLPPMYHKMISWVGLWVENNGMPKQKVGWHGSDEKEGLEKLFDALSTYKDFGLVHHNGRGFDLPLLTYRALKHGLQMPKRLNHYDIKYRYSNDNVDLLDEFSNYGASSWPKLKHLGYLIGIPFKQTGEGNEVLKMFREDKLAEIEHYCYEDVMATYVVWLHLKYTVGDIDKELFDNLNDRAMNKLNEIQGNND
ncbi:ribonuclease H-like domain-containing protein [Fodinibius sp.]|uniref:ribonuclease H-like domain-containing protein n=1 Tax=Fodinibius sp. TaxID=1872440 RepID=UPI002ACEE1A7|nr:ribonuclease H-like domain-containing protein [Fodinibius sp.]MDZ7659700.1 ribonuclease H-like domain-containing protein [Fodinibius sp.]